MQVVTGKWIVDAATVTNGTSYISGTLAFGPESSVEVVGNIEAVPRPGKGGIPFGEGGGHFRLAVLEA